MVAQHHHYKMLIADDDLGFRKTIRGILEPFFSLIEAESGEEAIEIVEFERVDIVLLDMHMHVLNGLETIRILKALDLQAPCILLTSDTSEELRQNARDADAFSVLAKPVSKTDLVTTISTAVETVYDESDYLPFDFS